MFRRLGTLVWGALGAFHLWLFAGQAWTGQVQSADLVRWSLALVLVAALLALRQHATSLFADRRATAVWLLVALLHGPVLAEDAGLASQVLAEAPAVAAQLVAAAAGLGLTLTLAARGGTGHVLVRRVPAYSAALTPARTLDADVGAGFLPRPPPA